MVPQSRNSRQANAVVAKCECGWESEPYCDEVEGGHDLARTSAVIETRLGHQAQTAVRENGIIKAHRVEYFDITVRKER